MLCPPLSIVSRRKRNAKDYGIYSSLIACPTSYQSTCRHPCTSATENMEFCVKLWADHFSAPKHAIAALPTLGIWKYYSITGHSSSRSFISKAFLRETSVQLSSWPNRTLPPVMQRILKRGLRKRSFGTGVMAKRQSSIFWMGGNGGLRGLWIRGARLPSSSPRWIIQMFRLRFRQQAKAVLMELILVRTKLPSDSVWGYYSTVFTIYLLHQNEEIHVWIEFNCETSLMLIEIKSNQNPPKVVLVPMEKVQMVRALTVFGYDDAPHGHAEVKLENIELDESCLMLGEGRGFEIAQSRLGPGRIHHCMRAVGLAARCYELMIERSMERETFGKRLCEHG